VFVAQDEFVKSIGFYIFDGNPQLDPLNTDLTLTFELYAGTGITGPVVARRTATVTAEILQTTTYPGGWIIGPPQGFLDADFTGVPLTVGDTYTATIFDPTLRWCATAIEFQPQFHIPGFEMMSAGYFYPSQMEFRVIDAAGDSPERIPLTIDQTSIPEPAGYILLSTVVGFYIAANVWRCQRVV
jgi:hypothetical protein